jgi:hypothetical protein
MVSGERDEPEPNTPSAVSLARVLRTLKRRGSSLLVVGLTPEEGRDRVCERMLGDDTAGSRRRLLVVTGADSAAVTDRSRRMQRSPPETTRYITYAANARGTSGDAPIGRVPNDGDHGADEAGETLPAGRHIEDGQLTELGAAIETEIDAIAEESGGLAPAELRVCLDSATPLLDTHDREAIRRFLDRVTTQVTDVHGMSHVHLPVARDWEAVVDLQDLFDAVVELRVEQGRTQQRWRLRDAEVISDWFDV